MYNPSNHIPLSKSMGPNAFPVDGKYMYFTNGQNGVYRYRPFQSTAEAIAYFPLGSPFRGSPEGQPWAFEILINEGGTLSVDGGYITGGINSVWWWRDGVADADLVKKNASPGEYLPLTGGTLTGPLTISNGENLYFRASEENPTDQGETVYLNFDGSEAGREYKWQYGDRFIIHYGERSEGEPPINFRVQLDDQNIREFLQTKLTVAAVTLSINWQTDLVPHEVDEILIRTYAQKHGNDISSIKGYYDDGGIITPYSPNYTYTTNVDGSINVLTITEIFAGTLIII